MTLEEFEKSLEEDKRSSTDGHSSHHQRRSHRSRERSHKHRTDDAEDRHRHKRRRRSSSRDRHKRHRHNHGSRTAQREVSSDGEGQEEVDEWVEKGGSIKDSAPTRVSNALQRDAWMEAPSALDIDFTQRGAQKPLESTANRSPQADFASKIHEHELSNHHLRDPAEAEDSLKDPIQDSPQRGVDYEFGDAGANWRMTKLKAVYARAATSGMAVDDVAMERYGDLRSFDDAREEQIELERRDTYGKDYVGKKKPNGDIFQERKTAMGEKNEMYSTEPIKNGSHEEHASFQDGDGDAMPLAKAKVDQTTLNRLKAQMMKAKLRGSTDAPRLEQEYSTAAAEFANQPHPNEVVLGAMESRMVAGGRKGEVNNINTMRGRERGSVEDNEDMSVEDMVREERRTRNQAGGDGRRFAERIAKDGKFDNDLDYMDENASKLAKRVQRSDINLKTMAISDFQKMNRVLDNCPLCYHEDTNTPPTAPVVSLATRTYLTLPTEPEISDGGACIVPVQHRGNLLECDDDEWEEIRNFMKSLIRMYHDQGRDVVFYENAAAPQRKKHAAMAVVPLPYRLGETAPAFFKESILAADEEWTQHRKLIDTLAMSRQELGKQAFRRTLVKEMPYFHVWFEIDGGLGHIVEDSNRWPKGDLFAREIIGGMLDREPDVIKRQGRWTKGSDGRIEGFRNRWRRFDWTRVLTSE